MYSLTSAALLKAQIILDDPNAPEAEKERARKWLADMDRKTRWMLPVLIPITLIGSIAVIYDCLRRGEHVIAGLFVFVVCAVAYCLLRDLRPRRSRQ